MDREEIIRRCKLMPKEGGYARSEIEPICKKFNIDTKGKLPELRKNLILSLNTQNGKEDLNTENGKDISDFSTEELRKYTAGKIVLRIAGCFCPPHIGHYNLVDTIISKIKPAIVNISTTNRSSNPRHGTPVEHTIKTWKDWSKILSAKYGVDFYISDFYNDKLIYDGGSQFIKAFISTNVWEGEKMPEEYRKNPLRQKSLEGMSLAFLNKVPRDFKGYYIYNFQREGDFSATQFTKCLKDLGRDCLMYVPDDVQDKSFYIREIRNKYYENLK